MPALACSTTQIRSKHWKPEFRKLRRLKVHKVKLPNFHQETDPSKMTPDQVKSRMKEMGLLPPRPWQERPILISCTSGSFEPYVPPEGDGKISRLSFSGAKQVAELMTKKTTSANAIRKINKFDPNFDSKEFAEQASEIYINAHKAMAEKDYEAMHQLVTEYAFPIMADDIRLSTIRWQFIKSLEPPRIVHARCTEVITKENIFGQVTVRFHTQQTLAVYDRFGRLLYGSEAVAKDVLEYVVFENHLANNYGKWRVHDKIIPDWMPRPQPAIKTFIKGAPQVVEEEEETTASPGKDQPAVAL
nr:EOG090X0DDP [Sida crystallina]